MRLNHEPSLRKLDIRRQGDWRDAEDPARVALRSAKVRYRPPNECRDTSVTMALMAGADPLRVARQHGHSLQVMMRDYAGWILKADRGRNLAAVNSAIKIVDSAGESQYSETKKQKSAQKGA